MNNQIKNYYKQTLVESLSLFEWVGWDPKPGFMGGAEYQYQNNEITPVTPVPTPGDRPPGNPQQPPRPPRPKPQQPQQPETPPKRRPDEFIPTPPAPPPVTYPRPNRKPLRPIPMDDNGNPMPFDGEPGFSPIIIPIPFGLPMPNRGPQGRPAFGF